MESPTLPGLSMFPTYKKVSFRLFSPDFSVQSFFQSIALLLLEILPKQRNRYAPKTGTK